MKALFNLLYSKDVGRMLFEREQRMLPTSVPRTKWENLDKYAKESWINEVKQ